MGYSGLIGGKTGFDNDSGWCLIEVAERGDTTLISVTLDGVAPDIWYQDNVELLDTGFSVVQEQNANGGTLRGELLSYRDPDAATIQGLAQSGASLGSAVGGSSQAQNPSMTGQAAVTTNQGDVGATVASGTNESADAGSEGRSEILAVIAVACLIAAFAALKAFGSKIMAGRHQTG
jgi:D-alanyl-D-alanine carboxypeptidase